MSKPKIYCADSNLVQPWFQPLWQEWFDVAVYDENTEYASGSIVITDNRFGSKHGYQQIKQHDYRIILSHLMDSHVYNKCEVIQQELKLCAQDWMWIQESLQYRYLNYHVPREPETPSRFFLLLMNLKRQSRDDLIAAVAPFLESSLYSYVERGIVLPDDIIVRVPWNSGNANDRLYVPNWYSQTCFSLVSETYVHPRLFVSEKIFKTLAYQHPMVVYGTPGSLSYIRKLGFETFGHQIDESYDTVTEKQIRLQKIVEVLDNLHNQFVTEGAVFQDQKTKQILEQIGRAHV